MKNDFDYWALLVLGYRTIKNIDVFIDRTRKRNLPIVERGTPLMEIGIFYYDGVDVRY